MATLQRLPRDLSLYYSGTSPPPSPPPYLSPSLPLKYFHVLHFISLRLEAEPGTIALLSEAELELVCSVEDYYDCSNFPRYDKTFLEHLKKAAEKHLVEKGQIRDTLALLKIYHRANEKRESEKTGPGNDSNSRKKHKANK